MSLHLYSNVKSNVPKEIVFKDKGIYSNQEYSDFFYGLYERESRDFDHKSLDIFSLVESLKFNQLDLFTDIKNDLQAVLDLYSKINKSENFLNLYTNVDETKEKQNLPLYSNISEFSLSDLSLYTKLICPDFKVYVIDSQTNQPINDVNWQLFRRDKTISLNQPVDQNHILVDSGIASLGTISIFLDDYNLRDNDDDYYLRIWKQQNIYTNLNLYISYYYEDYVNNLKKCTYTTLRTYLKKEGSGETVEKVIYQGAGGGGIISTPKTIRVKSKLIYYDELDVLCDLKEKIKIRTKLKSIKIDDIDVKLEGVFYV